MNTKMNTIRPTTFDKQHTAHINEPKQTKKWFMERVDKSIYSFQSMAGYYISNKEQAEMLYDLQGNGRRYKDLI